MMIEWTHVQGHYDSIQSGLVANFDLCFVVSQEHLIGHCVSRMRLHGPRYKLRFGDLLAKQQIASSATTTIYGLSNVPPANPWIAMSPESSLTCSSFPEQGLKLHSF